MGPPLVCSRTCEHKREMTMHEIVKVDYSFSVIALAGDAFAKSAKLPSRIANG